MSLEDVFKERFERATESVEDVDDNVGVDDTIDCDVDSATIRAVKEIESTNDVQVYSAEQGEIECWHSFGSNVFVQSFLRKYDLQVGTNSYDAFKIGLDTDRNAITFAVDDSHYIMIRLEDDNATPIDNSQVARVLNKVNLIRYERLENYQRQYEVMRKIF